MTGDERDRRDSRALEPELITDPQEKAAAEARNGCRQYDAAIGAIHSALERGAFSFGRPSSWVFNGKLWRESAHTLVTTDQAALRLKAASMNLSVRILFQN